MHGTTAALPTYSVLHRAASVRCRGFRTNKEPPWSPLPQELSFGDNRDVPWKLFSKPCGKRISLSCRNLLHFRHNPPTVPSQPLSQPCLPPDTILMTPEDLHGCHRVNDIRGHCFHLDLGGCTRHVSPRISGGQDRRPDGETAYGEGANSRDHSPAKTGASCFSSSTAVPFGNQLTFTPILGRSVALFTTPDGRRQLRLCQWICRGFRSQYASNLEMACRDAVDIFLLQETLLLERSTIILPRYRPYPCRGSSALAVVSPFWLSTPSPVSRNNILSLVERGWRFRLSRSVFQASSS